MQQLTNTFLVSSIILAMGGTASVAFFSKPSHGILAGLAGGTVGGGLGTLLISQKNKYQTKKEPSFRETLTEEIKPIFELLNQLKTQLDIQDQQLVNLKNIRGILEEKFGQDSLLLDNELVTSKEIKDLVIAPEIVESNDLSIWLLQKNIKVESSGNSIPNDSIFDQIALFLGDNYSSLSELYKEIKRSISTKKEFQFDLSKINKENIDVCIEFLQMLAKNDFLANFDYNISQKNIKINFNFNKIGLPAFLTGKWFERYIYHKTTEIFKHKNIQYELLRNAQLIFNDNKKVEIDLLFLINKKLIWIECKTGVYCKCIPQYSQYQNLFGVEKNQGFLVKLNLSDKNEENLKNSYNFTVVNEKSFLEKIQTIN